MAIKDNVQVPGLTVAEMVAGYYKSVSDQGDLALLAAGAMPFTFVHLFPPTQGSLSATLSITVPQNAVIRDFALKITAKPASEAVAAEVAQLRVQSVDDTTDYQIIVDFGRVRTVSAVKFSSGVEVKRVDAWTGTEFPQYTSSSAFYQYAAPFPARATFKSEVRTEKLRITVGGGLDSAALLGDLAVILPDAPRDLAVTMDGGAPVWNLPGPAASGAGTALQTDTWNSANQRRVDLTDVLQGIVGDPATPATRTVEFTLTSQEAGVLEIEQEVLDYDIIRRAVFDGADTLTLDFDAEGQVDVPLHVPGAPAGAVARSITLTARGDLGMERRVPALGPVAAPASSTDAAPLIEVEITSERALILRLDETTGLPELRGLRLPLLAGADGAEIRLLPWDNAGPGRHQPLAPRDDLTGDPVTLAAGGAAPVWTSVLFGDVLPTDPDNLPWVALLVARGAVRVGLSAGAGAQMRVGPPSGPWRSMPALFGTPPYAGLRFPYRALGDAVDASVPVPVTIDVPRTSAAQDFVPVAAGAALTLDPITVTNPSLRITHAGLGTLSLGAVDIVYDT